MAMTLKVLRGPDPAKTESRIVTGDQFTLGRAASADWSLVEPGEAPQLSRRHCTLRRTSGNWTLIDTSTNGTFLNGERLSIDAESQPLQDGDRLRLGGYEIEIGFGADTAAGAFPAPALFAGEDAEHSPFKQRSFDAAPHEDESGRASMRLPEGFAAELHQAFSGPPAAQSDHSPAYADVIRAPSARVVLPSGWDDSADTDGPVRPTTPHTASLRPDPAVSRSAPDALLSAFLDGAGLPRDIPVSDGSAAMRAAGAAFRAFVHGLRRALIARAEVKSAFRIDQTMIRSKRNNPLKFAAGDDDALAALFGNSRHTDMTAAQAIEGALADIRLHELATMAAMQEAVQEMLGKLDPARFAAAAGGGGVLQASKRARAFELYEAEFSKLRESFQEKFDDVFGRAFARAYERVIDDLRGKEPPS